MNVDNAEGRSKAVDLENITNRASRGLIELELFTKSTS